MLPIERRGVASGSPGAVCVLLLRRLQRFRSGARGRCVEMPPNSDDRDAHGTADDELTRPLRK